jgi:hypothetical protein
MKTQTQNLTRRYFLKFVTRSGVTAGLPWPAIYGLENPRRRKTILSFYCDDTSPYTAGAAAFQILLDYCAEQRLAGEASGILGIKGHSMVRDPNEEELAFTQQVSRAWVCGIDTHCELMTHRGLFDFQANHELDGAVHEGLVARARRRGIACAITSGMACVAFGVAEATKDCDWLCAPAAAGKFLDLLGEASLRGQFRILTS